MLYTNRDQLATDLLYLVKEDPQLLSDIVYNYCQLIPNNQFNDLEDYVNNERRSIVQPLLTSSTPLFYFIMLNCFEKYGLQKGYTLREIHASKVTTDRTYPDRYDSYEEYQDALHDYMNGM